LIKKIILGITATIIAYLALWPVPIDPIAWSAPNNKGYIQPFNQNQQLSLIKRIELDDAIGPEDYALAPDGNIYFGLRSGEIRYLDRQGDVHHWLNTGGRPLGMEFDKAGNLIVADAFLGLLTISSAGEITSLVTETDGIAVKYADDIDIANNGKIYFSDASTKFDAEKYGTYAASMLDIMEHGGHGRLIEYDPTTNTSTTLLNDVNFANGVAVSHDQQSVLLNETGSYRILKVGISERNRGRKSLILENLPGFPDNINRGSNGLYWLGLVSPRSDILDALSNYGFIRKIIQRLPKLIQPKAQRFGHVIAINDRGEVIHNLQDPNGKYGATTGALEIGNTLYISSLHDTALGKFHGLPAFNE